MTEDLTLDEQLEKIVDRVRLAAVIAALARICHEKADHVRTNWQDKDLADAWQFAGDSIGGIEDDAGINGVSW